MRPLTMVATRGSDPIPSRHHPTDRKSHCQNPISVNESLARRVPGAGCMLISLPCSKTIASPFFEVNEPVGFWSTTLEPCSRTATYCFSPTFLNRRREPSVNRTTAGGPLLVAASSTDSGAADKRAEATIVCNMSRRDDFSDCMDSSRRYLWSDYHFWFFRSM